MIPVKEKLANAVQVIKDAILQEGNFTFPSFTGRCLDISMKVVMKNTKNASRIN